jgi:adenylate cyclase
VMSADPAPSWVAPPIDYASLEEVQRQMLLEAVAPYLPAKLYEDLVSRGNVVGDHRPVTNLFLHFSGLDYDRDPDVGAKLQTYVSRVQEIIYRYDGTLNRVLTGDKGSEMHILFGAPVAHEDDKARALRCALALQEVPGKLPFIRTQRVGLASGYVFAGPVGAIASQHDMLGDWLPGVRGEYTVMGDMVNLSARLTGVCPPGQVLVDAYTRSRTAQRFEFQSVGPVELKGKSQPVTPYLLKQERPAENTLVTRYLLSQRPLVGRHDELLVIRQAVSDALGGQSRLLAITGPAGVGKSRLIEDAVRRWLEAGGIGYGGDCISHGAETPYLPWADLWRAQFDLHENDTPQERQEKVLRSGRALGLDLSEWAALVTGLLGLPLRPYGEEHPALAALDPQARHVRLLDLTTDLITAQARHTPTLLLFEDLHWADRSSLELIDYVAQRIGDAPLLICMAYRPRDAISLSCLQRPLCHVLRLGELTNDEELALITSMLGDVDLPPAFLRLVSVRAQGNPLFVEELVKGLMDAGLLQRENGRYRVVGDLDRIEVPDTVEAVLLARIDRLEAPARDLLRVASVIGRQFAFAVLRGIYPYGMIETEMLERLTTLERLDMTRLERPEPELEYLFKHALTQDVAYESLSFTLRRDLHQRIGGFLEQHYGDHLETMYSMLAHHFTRGEQRDRALTYALAAGAQAQALYANDEALAHYAQAESLLAQLPPRAHEAEAIKLYQSRGELHTVLGNFDEAEADLERGLRLAQGAPDHRRAQAQALNGLAYLRYWQAHNEEMLQLAQRALELAEEGGHRREIMMALRYAALALDELGSQQQAIEYLSRARALAEELDDRYALSVIHEAIAISEFNQGRLRNALEAFEMLLVIYRESGDKIGISACLNNIANSQYYLGDFYAARAAFLESIAIAREIAKRAGMAYSLRELGGLSCHQGDYAAGLAELQEANTVFEEIDDAAGRAWCDLALGREYYLDVGPVSQAQALLHRALPVLQANESHEQVVETLLALGRLYLSAGKEDQARANLDQALALCQNHDLYWHLPEANVRLAELALAQGDGDSAASFAQQTLAAIAAGGCPDLGAAAHLVLAQLADEPHHHYQMAVNAARRRSRRIDLARTLFKVGDYLRGRAEPALQMQGHAHVHEAQNLMAQMQLTPGHDSL